MFHCRLFVDFDLSLLTPQDTTVVVRTIESFESPAWTNDGIVADGPGPNAWTRTTQTTPSSSTGPDAAYDGAYYLFTEASSNFNEEFLLDIPQVMYAGSNHTVEFWYHMFGQDTGSLSVEMAAVAGAPAVTDMINSNDYSSWGAMQSNGWTETGMTYFDMSDAAMSAYCQTAGTAGTADAGWFGNADLAQVGTLSVTMPVTGTATVDFGNCWTDAGTVLLSLNGVQVATAAPSEMSVVRTVSVQVGDVLALSDEGANPVIRLNSIHVTAMPSSPTPAAARQRSPGA